MTVHICVYKFLFAFLFFGKKEKNIYKTFHILKRKAHFKKKTYYGYECLFWNPFWRWKHVFGIWTVCMMPFVRIMFMYLWVKRIFWSPIYSEYIAIWFRLNCTQKPHFYFWSEPKRFPIYDIFYDNSSLLSSIIPLPTM